MLMEMAREEEQCMLRLENASLQLIEEISELKKSMDQIQRRLDNSEISSGLQVKLPRLNLRWGLNLGDLESKFTFPQSCSCYKNTPKCRESGRPGGYGAVQRNGFISWVRETWAPRSSHVLIYNPKMFPFIDRVFYCLVPN